VVSLVSTSGPTVLVVTDPDDCFSCSGLLNQWLTVGARHGWNVQLLLSRPPNEHEELQLRFHRLRFAGIVKGLRRTGSSAAFFFQHGALVDSAFTPEMQRLMIQHWAASPAVP
jgi:hypothetical protein